MAITGAQIQLSATAETAAAENAILRLAGKLGAAGPLVAGAAVAGAAVVGIGLAAAHMAGDFQAGMTGLVTGAGEAKSNLALVSNGILDLAVKTGTTTKQLTDGMFMIESAGYHGQKGLDVLKAAAEGAKVGQADLGTVADATTTILKDFGDTGINANQAVNALIATVASGKTHMEDLAGAMSQILPTASAAKVSLNDVMGALATMTGEGVPAANAATYLRQTILALVAPGKQAQDTLASIGLKASDVAAEMSDPNAGLTDTLKTITDALKKKFPEGSAAYVAALKDIAGGSKQLQGILDLTGSHMQDFHDNALNIGKSIHFGGDAISGWSEVQGDFNQKLAVAREVFETLMIKLGTKLLPILGSLVTMFATHLPGAINTVTGFFRRVGDAVGTVIRFFQDTGPASTGVKIALGILGGAMLGLAASAVPRLVASVLASVGAFGAQAAAAGAAAVATLAAAGPFILVGAGIAAVVAGVILLVTHLKQVGEFIGGLVKGIGGLASAFTNIGNDNIPVLSGLFKGLGTVIGGIADVAKTVFGGLVGIITLPFKPIVWLVNKVIDALDLIHVQIPDWVPVVGGKGFGINIPEIKIPGFAGGGRVDTDGPIMVGEDGAEILTGQKGKTVIPIPAGMRRQGGTAVAGMAGGVPLVVHLYLNKTHFGMAVAQALPQAVRQGTGTRRM